MPCSRVCVTGGVLCDVTLKLPCDAEVPAVSLFLQAASPFFCNALEDVQGGAPIPVRLACASDSVAA